jgi:hypothetical protein
MLRMDHYPYSRFWAIWDDQDLVAVVVYKKGAVELLRRLQAHAPPSTYTSVAAPAAPTATERPGERRRTVQRSRRLAQGSHGSRSTATPGRHARPSARISTRDHKAPERCAGWAIAQPWHLTTG